MKKLIALAFLSAAGLASTAGQAPAWFCCHNCCNKCCTSKCCTTICCVPYNAFTPVCCGTMTCMGCCQPCCCQQCCCQPCCPPAMNCCCPPAMNCCYPPAMNCCPPAMNCCYPPAAAGYGAAPWCLPGGDALCSQGSCGLGDFGRLPLLNGANGGLPPAYAGMIYQNPGVPAPGMQGPSLPGPTFKAPMPTPASQNGMGGYGPNFNPGYPAMMQGTASLNAFGAPPAR